MEKQKYQTKQGTQLLTYLQANPGKHITANDIAKHFRDQDISMGVATIYRHLDRFAEEGVVLKYSIDSNSPACYEYHSQGEPCTHVHCKCEKCGLLIHLLCTQFQGIESHLKEHHEFSLNPQKTVLYGLCQACQEEKSH